MGIAHNVLAVTDVFAVAIKEHEVFKQQQKCGGEKTHKGRSPTGFFRSPSRRRRRCSYSPVMRWAGVHHYLIFLIYFYISSPSNILGIVVKQCVHLL
jgi:hypothetical protein